MKPSGFLPFAMSCSFTSAIVAAKNGLLALVPPTPAGLPFMISAKLPPWALTSGYARPPALNLVVSRSLCASRYFLTASFW
jgi:hypothetical protein